MGLFDNFQNVAKKSEELAQSAAKKSGEMLEITRITLKMKEEEKELKSLYTTIGETIFDKYSKEEPIPEYLSNAVLNVKLKKEIIENLKKEIETIKGTENRI